MFVEDLYNEIRLLMNQGQSQYFSPDDVMVDMSDFGSVSTELPYLGVIPGSGPRLAANTLETCSPAVRDAYFMLNPEERSTLGKGFVKFVKKNWKL